MYAFERAVLSERLANAFKPDLLPALINSTKIYPPEKQHHFLQQSKCSSTRVQRGIIQLADEKRTFYGQ